jgi:hypothetical protein
MRQGVNIRDVRQDNTIGLTADGPQFGPPGYEVNLLYIGGLLALILIDAGALSIDGLLARRRNDSRRPSDLRSPTADIVLGTEVASI